MGSRRTAGAGGAAWWEGVARVVFLGFFVSHIPATALVDAQAVLPAWVFPGFARDALAWWVTSCGDPLMGARPLWFRAIVTAEVTLQFPFFFYAIRGLLARDDRIRVPCVAYAGHVCTTMVPILAELVWGGHAATASQRALLVAVYLPYLVVPLGLLAFMASAAAPFHRDRSARRLRVD